MESVISGTMEIANLKNFADFRMKKSPDAASMKNAEITIANIFTPCQMTDLLRFLFYTTGASIKIPVRISTRGDSLQVRGLRQVKEASEIRD